MCLFMMHTSCFHIFTVQWGWLGGDISSQSFLIYSTIVLYNNFHNLLTEFQSVKEFVPYRRIQLVPKTDAVTTVLEYLS